jgi:hypothetical protein
MLFYACGRNQCIGLRLVRHAAKVNVKIITLYTIAMLLVPNPNYSSLLWLLLELHRC